MTLIAISRQQEAIYCFSDTRYSSSSGARGILDYFQKQFVLNIRSTVGSSASALDHTYEHQLGFAFEGASLLGASLALLSNHVLQNLHAQSAPSAPTFDEILDSIHRVALLMHDQIVVTHPEGSIYRAMIFGFCPATGKPKLGQIYLDTATQPYTVAVGELSTENGRLHLFGSGKPDFEATLGNMQSHGETITLERVFRKTLISGLDPGTGGGIQVSRTLGTLVSMPPVVMPTDGRDLPDVYVGGLNVTDFGTVGGYSIGREIIGIDPHG